MVQKENIPQYLKEHGKFCLWKYEQTKDGKPTKVPYKASQPQYRARSDDPKTFSNFATAITQYNRLEGFDGIGVGIFDGIAGIDIDHCINNSGELSPMAKDIVDKMDAYTEISPSGHGIRILFLANGFSYDVGKYHVKNSKNGLEIYVAGMTKRFLTITGNCIRQSDMVERGERLHAILDKYMKRETTEKAKPQARAMPLELSDLELIDKAGQAQNGDTFRALWSGAWEGLYKSQSEADLALCNILAFWTGCDAARMDSLFRNSGLMRDKWTRKQSGTTYGALTIQSAVNGCREVYNPQSYNETPGLNEAAQAYVERRRKDAQTRTDTKDGVIVPKERREPLKLITAQELLAMDIPPLQWLVDGLLPQNSVGMIVSPPKYYKSYMCIDLALSICSGKVFLGRKTHKTEVLYCDLESTKRRPRDRIKQILGLGKQAPSGFYLVTIDNKIGILGNGFEESMEQAFSTHPGIKLVIVDVLKCIRPNQRRNQNAYDADYEVIEAIRAQAMAHKASFLIVHHTRKMRDISDSYNDISGSTGMLGAVDFVWMINKERRSDENAVFSCTGRDLESVELGICFDKVDFRWKYLGTAEEMQHNERMQAYEENAVIHTIKKLLSTNDGKWSGTAGELKSASRYLGREVQDNPSKIGRTISDYSDFLRGDNIVFSYSKSKDKRRERIYSFSCPTCP